MSRNSNLMSIAALGLTAGAALSLGGLGGCSKPPPTGSCCAGDGSCSVSKQSDCSASWTLNGVCEPNPCRQPPPPPKEQVSLETVAQNEKADARVQFAADLKVDEDELDLAKAIVKLADAIARGDDKALKPMLTRRAQGLLETLENSGEWEEATKPIEAVRVVLMRQGIDFQTVAVATAPPGETADLMGKVMAAMQGVPPEQLAAISKAAQDALAGSDPAAMASDPAKLAEFQAKIVEAMKAAGVSEEVQAKLAGLTPPPAPADVPAAPSGGSNLGVLIAVQDVRGAYLLGWAAEKVGDHWAFANTPATPDIRPRASLWDNVGPEGFQVMRLASAPGAPRDPSADAPAGGGGGSAPGVPGSGGGEGSGGGGGDPGSPSAPPDNPGVPNVPRGPNGPHPHG